MKNSTKVDIAAAVVLVCVIGTLLCIIACLLKEIICSQTIR